MKRTKWFVVGLLVGISLILGATAFADEIKSYIGKQIEGQFPITIDNERIEQPGLVIEGVSYLPVRVAGELFGYNVSFVDSEVILEKIENPIEFPDVETEDPIGDEEEMSEQNNRVNIPDLPESNPFDGVKDERILQSLEKDRTRLNQLKGIIQRELASGKTNMIKLYEGNISELEQIIADKEAELRRRGVIE